MKNYLLFLVVVYISIWFAFPEVYGLTYGKMIKGYETEMRKP